MSGTKLECRWLGVLVGVCAVNVNGTVGFSISVEDGGGGQM